MNEKIKRLYNFIFHDNSTLSWIVNVVLAFIIVKFILYPLLGIILSTSYPLVAVISSSMDHDILLENGVSSVCGSTYPEAKNLNLDEYWKICGDYYEKNFKITKQQFRLFSLSNGLKKGDIVILYGADEVEIGDIVVYPNPKFRYPIIHRVVGKNGEKLITKGDHNSREDPVEVTEILGKAVFKIPKLGYIKIIAVDYIWNPIFRR